MHNGQMYTNAGRLNLPHTEIRMANPHITESESQRALEALNPHEAANTVGRLPKALKTLSLDIAPTLSRIFNFTLLTSQVTDDWRHAIVTLVAKAPPPLTHTHTHSRPKPIQVHQSDVCCVQPDLSRLL